MINFFCKYGAFLFIVNTILLSIKITYTLGGQIFLILMSLYFLIIIFNPKIIQRIIFHKSFKFLIIINLINLIYFFFFHSLNDFEAIKYFLARSVQFSVISISVFIYKDFYKKIFLKYVSYIIFIVLFIGFLRHPNLFEGRYSGIIWNPNALSSFSVIALAMLFFSNHKKKVIDYFIMISFVVFSIASGSRGALLGIGLMYFLAYGISYKNILYFILSLIIYFSILNFDFDTSFHRFAAQDLLNDRILQFKYAILSIENRLFTGYGLDKYAYLDKSLVPIHLKSSIIGAHNGYLSLLTQYGILFGFILLYIIIYKSYTLFFYFKGMIFEYGFYLYIIIYTLVASIYESLIVGINEFHTILFWLSLTYLSHEKFVLNDKN